MTRLLADENVEAPLVTRLRAAGHDVAYVAEDSPGVLDEVVLTRGVSEQRVLLTGDKDFAALAFLQQRASHGILLVRMGEHSSAAKAARIVQVLKAHGGELAGSMTVIEPDAIRRRWLPRR